MNLPRKYEPLECVLDVHSNAGVVDDWTVLVSDTPRVPALWFLKVLVLRESQKRTEIRPLTEVVYR